MEFISAKTILSGYSQKNTWFGSHYNMNIYKGCCHGCIYCDSRSGCYGVDNFDRVRAKKDALDVIERELKSKRKKGVIATGAMSDPYNPFEKEYQLTRGALKLIKQFGFGVAITTKSDLILRDIDLLKEIAERSPVLIKITITARDEALCRKIEQGVAASSKRFAVLKELADEGLFVGVLLMPVLPFITDTQENISQILEISHDKGAKFIYPAFGVTLRDNQRDWYYKKLDENFPGVKEKYIKNYGNSYQCSSPYAKKLWEAFHTQCSHLGMLYKMEDIIKGYKGSYESQHTQISLFES